MNLVRYNESRGGQESESSLWSCSKASAEKDEGGEERQDASGLSGDREDGGGLRRRERVRVNNLCPLNEGDEQLTG